MNRKDFLKSACSAGLCSCTVASLFATMDAQAADATAPAKTPEAPPPEDWRVGFARDRYALLLSTLEQKVDKAAFSEALQVVGAFCAGKSGMLEAFAGKPDDFLAELEKRWKANVQHDKEKSLVNISFPVHEGCPCPLSNKGKAPAVMCECSLGWQRQAFGKVIGKPVQVQLKESLLRGGKQCAFEIKYA
jgi:hypothetical protein